MYGIVIEAASKRNPWHVDWPFNSESAMHIKKPFPDVIIQITSVWMLDDFTHENGTIILPKSHKLKNEPSKNSNLSNKINGEKIIEGKAGSVLLMDSRLGHAPAQNRTQNNRVALSIRYVPWWLNIYPLYDSQDRINWVTNKKLRENLSPQLTKEKFDTLPISAQALLFHMKHIG